MRRRVLWTGVSLATLAVGGLLHAEPAPPPSKQPSTQAGPYRVALDRISQNYQVGVTYQAGGRRSTSNVQARRSIHLQMGVFTDVPSAKVGLSILQVKNVTAEGNGRVQELSHYGGIMESANDTAAVRAYLYVPVFPALATEIRSIEGEIVSYDHSGPLRLDLPVNGKIPATIEKEGVKATVREFTAEGDTARAVVWVEGPSSSVLLNTTNDGSYGVSLLNAQGQTAAPTGGAMLQPRQNQAEYRVGFQATRGVPTTLRVDLLYRAGPKRVYPFRIEHVALPHGAVPRPGEAPDGNAAPTR